MSTTVLDPIVWEPGVSEPSLTPAAPAPAPPASPLGGPEDFRRWLERFPPEQSCGQPYNAMACPLARYLRTRVGPHSELSVKPQRYLLGARYYEMPRWAELFVICVDRPRPLGGRISAGQALHYLDLALDEERRQEREGMASTCV